MCPSEMQHLTSERMIMHAGGVQAEMIVSYYDDGSIEIKQPPGALTDKNALWLRPIKKNLCNAKPPAESALSERSESAL